RSNITGVCILGKGQGDREYVACCYGTGCCKNIAGHVQDYDHFHVGLLSLPHVAERAHNQEEYQYGSDASKGAYEQVSENRNSGCLRNNKSKDDTNDQSTNDTFDQTDAVPFANDVFNCLHLFSQIFRVTISASSLSSKFWILVHQYVNNAKYYYTRKQKICK